MTEFFINFLGLILLRLLIVLSNLAILATATNTSSAEPNQEPPTLSKENLKKLLPELRKGGFILYFRHLETDQDQEDSYPVDLNDCSKQRNLSPEGINRGRSIAQAFRKLQIPVGDVISSPFCRTEATGKLIAGKATIDLDLFFAISLTKEGKERKGAALLKMLQRMPEKGKNTLIIGHTANLQEAVGLWPKPEGVAYLFKPEKNAPAKALARIEPTQWSAASN
jgi:phosphohistidine phosphatase SixA